MKKKILLSLSAAALISVSAFAQPGMLDAGFGNNGVVISAYTDFNEAYSVAMQSDGKIVVGGYSGNYGLEDFALLRYNVNGSPDNTFGTSGKVVTTISSGVDRGQCVLIQPDGKIILTGFSHYMNDAAITTVRYLSSGTIDTTFGTQGMVITPVGVNGPSYAYTAALQPDGKIIVGGYGNTVPGGDVALIRYNSNGTLDNSFGAGGIVSADMNGNYDLTFGIALQPDGKIVASVYHYDGAHYRFGVMRFNANGSFDNSFGTGGKVTTTIDYDDAATGIALQADGKIILCGYTWRVGLTDTDLALARYNTNGTLDNTFGTGGILTDIDSTVYCFTRAVVMQPDGKILVTGQHGLGGFHSFLLQRFNSNGSLDTSFNSTGRVTTDVGGVNDQDYACALTMQADGKIVAAGATVVSSLSDVDVAVVRYLSGLDVGVVDFALENNSVFVYPNPVSANATIAYTLTQTEKISIDITDMQGRIISSVLNNELQQAGKYTQAFEIPETLASGTYLLVLSTQQGKVSVKMVK
jgi:uncharacterized delta-60 repeat protein